MRDLVREVNKDLTSSKGDYPATLPRSTSDDPEHVTAGDVAAQVFATYSMPWRYVRHLPPRIRLLTWGMAGERLRSIYGVEWSAGHEHRFRRTVPTVRLRQGLCPPGPIRRRHGRRQRIRRATPTQADRGDGPPHQRTERPMTPRTSPQDPAGRRGGRLPAHAHHDRCPAAGRVRPARRDGVGPRLQRDACARGTRDTPRRGTRETGPAPGDSSWRR